MKENAEKASKSFAASKASWPATGAAKQVMAGLPGAALTANRLKAYVDASPEPVEVHLIGHSAGSIFLGAMLDRLAGVPIASLTYLAPAIRVDTFLTQVVPHLGSHVREFATFGMSAQRELDDVCGAGGRNIYQKSLLYLVSRALEHPREGESEVPLLGMQRFADTKVEGTTFNKAIQGAGGSVIWSASQRPANSRSDSASHGGFDDDVPTMTSVMLRVLGSTTPSDVAKYRRHAQRVEPEPTDTSTPAGVGGAPALATADVGEKGSVPVTQQAAAGPKGSDASDSSGISVNPTVAALQRDGWAKAKS